MNINNNPPTTQIVKFTASGYKPPTLKKDDINIVITATIINNPGLFIIHPNSCANHTAFSAPHKFKAEYNIVANNVETNAIKNVRPANIPNNVDLVSLSITIPSPYSHSIESVVTTNLS